MLNPGFVHLHVHSSYSLQESANTVEGLVKLAEADGQPALALTDTDNLFGALEFSEKAAKAGIQPIHGIHLNVSFEGYKQGTKQPRPNSFGIVLLAQDEQGYNNLMALSSQAFFDVPLGDQPLLHIDELHKFRDGLICLTGGHTGPVDAALAQGKPEEAEARMRSILAIYGGDNLYVEIQRHGMPSQERIEQDLVRLADTYQLPLVATNEPFFPTPEDWEAHDALLALQGGTVVSDENRRRLNMRFSFKSREKMIDLFQDLPDAIQATVDIAQRCHYRTRTRKPILPSFGEGDEAAELGQQAIEGLELRLQKHGTAPGFAEQQYRDRLTYELEIIERMGFPGYFLIVSDFIKWAKTKDIPVGPGRGSGAGSVVAWALMITDLDPLRWGLLFERFLNPERVSMPDFDIDFCVEGRDRVIDYVRGKYGEGNVGKIITFGTMLARSVLRDVGRAMEMPFGLVNRLSTMVPVNPAKPVKLAQAVADEPRLQAAIIEEDGVEKLIEVSKRLEGLHRHSSTHAAGVVIGDRPLEQLVPLYRDPLTGERVTQFNMKWVEPAGLVKFDFLGLKTLTVIRRAVDMLKARGVDLDISTIPLDDAKTYEMMRKADVTGVFQVESTGMRKALVEMQVDRLEDIIALVALYRPGPMANIPVYCERKLGGDDQDRTHWYPHPELAPILSETFGIIVYQEQVMEVAKVLAGYSLGDADLLRRAMGKKIKAEMDAQRGRFVRGCVERGLDLAHAEEIFDLLAKFADYGFNKSHAAAYALISYQTAYLKANYPGEFLAASMTMEMDSTDKIAEFRAEAEKSGFTVEPPSLNTSGATFMVKDRTIHYALAAIKGVGVSAAEEVVALRGDRPFRDLGELASRITPRLLNKRVMERLVMAGALDGIERDRARAMAAVGGMVSFAQRQEKRGTATGDLFGVEAAPITLKIPAFTPWTETERLQHEYEAVGSFLTGHPLDEYGSLLRDVKMWTWKGLQEATRAGAEEALVAATVLKREEKRSKAGKKFGILTLSDQTGQYEVLVFSDNLEKYRSKMEPGARVAAKLWTSLEGDEVRVRLKYVKPLEDAVTESLTALKVQMRPEPDTAALMALTGTQGDVAVSITDEDGVEVEMPGRYGVTPAMIQALRASPGIRSVAVS